MACHLFPPIKTFFSVLDQQFYKYSFKSHILCKLLSLLMIILVKNLRLLLFNVGRSNLSFSMAFIYDDLLEALCYCC